MRFQQADDDVRAAGATALPLGEHRVGLADTWCGAEIDPELSPGHTSTFLQSPVSLTTPPATSRRTIAGLVPR